MCDKRTYGDEVGEGIKGGMFDDVWMHKVKKAKWSEERGKTQPVKQEI